VLKEYGVARHEIHRQVSQVRSEGYQMLRSPSLLPAEVTEIADALGGASTETLILEDDWRAAGRTIDELKLRTLTGATVITVVREGHTEINPGPDFRLEADDVLVLLGNPEQIDRAVEHLQKRNEEEGETVNG
jgi:CPA2 family monovalent cation:H+ antiporter-2